MPPACSCPWDELPGTSERWESHENWPCLSKTALPRGLHRTEGTKRCWFSCCTARSWQARLLRPGPRCLI